MQLLFVVLVVVACGCLCWVHDKHIAPSVPVQSIPSDQNYDDGYLDGVLKAIEAQKHE